MTKDADARIRSRCAELQQEANAVGEHYRAQANAIVDKHIARLREVASDIHNPKWHGVDVFADLKDKVH